MISVTLYLDLIHISCSHSFESCEQLPCGSSYTFEHFSTFSTLSTNFSEQCSHTSSLFIWLLTISFKILDRRSKYYKILSFEMVDMLTLNTSHPRHSWGRKVHKPLLSPHNLPFLISPHFYFALPIFFPSANCHHQLLPALLQMWRCAPTLNAKTLLPISGWRGNGQSGYPSWWHYSLWLLYKVCPHSRFEEESPS